MQARRLNTRTTDRAFTLIEVLIVLVLLLTVASLVLPRVLDRGLGDLTDDTRLRLDAALLDAQREARRTGQTVEVVLRTGPGGNRSEILIQTMAPDDTTTRDTTDPATGDAASWWGTDDTSAPQNGPAASASPGLDELDASSVTLVYAMPDGTLVPTSAALVIETEGESFDLTIDAPSARVTLTPRDPDAPVDSADAKDSSAPGSASTEEDPFAEFEDASGGWSP